MCGGLVGQGRAAQPGQGGERWAVLGGEQLWLRKRGRGPGAEGRWKGPGVGGGHGQSKSASIDLRSPVVISLQTPGLQ